MSFGTLCHYVRFDGQQCGSPALRGKVFCYYHARSRSNLQGNIVVPPLDSPEAAAYAGRNLLNLMLNRRITVNELRAAVYCMRFISGSIARFNSKPEATVTDVSRHVAHEVAFAGPDADQEPTAVDGAVVTSAAAIDHPERAPESGPSDMDVVARDADAVSAHDFIPVAPPSETPQLSAALPDPFIPGPGELDSPADLHQRRPIPPAAKLPPPERESPFAFAQDTWRKIEPNDGSYPRRTTDALRDYLEHEYRKRYGS